MTNTIFPSKLILPKFRFWLSELAPTHFVSLVFNRNETLDSGFQSLKKFHASIDRKILGVDWYKKPIEERTLFIAFPEHIHSNLHYHLLLKVDEKYFERFEQHAPNVWKGLVKSGSIKIDPLKAERDKERVISYCTKEQYKDENYRSFVLSTGFCSK